MDLALGQITDWLECFKSVFGLLLPLFPAALSLSEVSLWGLDQHSDGTESTTERFLTGGEEQAVPPPPGWGGLVPRWDSSVKCNKREF